MPKADVIAQLETIYHSYNEIVMGLTPEQLDAQPNPDAWSIKDILGHLVFWDDNFANKFRAMLNLEPRAVLSGTLDEINAKAYAEYHAMPAREVLVRFKQIQDDLIAAMSLFTDEQLDKQGLFEASGERSLGAYVVHEVEGHWGEHLGELRQLAAEVTR